MAPASYRVVAFHCDRSRSLVTLAPNRRAAANLAKAVCDAMERNGHGDGIASVRVEQWIGTLTEGAWLPVSQRRGGFSHRLAARVCRKCGQRNPSLPKTGDKADCILLAERTRKGGWRARLLKSGVEGPVTNSADLPASAEPGQQLTLRLGAISQDGKCLQFHWRADDNASAG